MLGTLNSLIINFSFISSFLKYLFTGVSILIIVAVSLAIGLIVLLFGLYYMRR